ncbi:MAG TPA: aminomethyl-transferring glycine dehydrogenase subunit GcvPA [Elusimicrobiota bacterium]|nr:aminomethyl-transferring glycine dehydrogenase subunit GcvPA [Elusimicrobiota bacterium]
MFIPYTAKQRDEILKTVGVRSFEELIGDLPQDKLRPSYHLPPSITEMELLRHMDDLSKRAFLAQSFLGAGAYEHFIPTAVWSLALRGEFATAYTPYQPEASQGTLQSIYEFQTLICELFSMDVSNASLYDGASAAAEACLLAARHTGRTEILIPETVHPHTRQVISTYLAHSGAKIVLIPFQQPTLSGEILKKHLNSDTAALLLQTPNFFGCLEDPAPLSKIVHEAGALLISSTYPAALGLISPPGEYDADIAVAEGQSLGVPLSYGGPYLGLFACKKELMRKMPGRVVGQTVDLDGKRGFVLTLQAREQHIRREKAMSNICTNQALCALASTIHMALLGKKGLARLADINFQKAHYAADQLQKNGVPLTFTSPFFNEFAVRFPRSPDPLIDSLGRDRILAGFPLGKYYPSLKNDLLVCVTEIKTKQDIDDFVTRVTEWARP